MSWDITTPADTDSIRNGASVIRTLKTDLQTALQSEGIFPGTDVANPVFRWKPNYGTTVNRPGTPATGQLYVNTTLNVIERYNGASWDQIATLIPSGTVMPFYQAAAPQGWTQIVTQNDAAMRVVSGAGGGSGGTDSIANPPSHQHALDVTLNGGAGFSTITISAAHDSWDPHFTAAKVGFAPKYIDMILCSKT